MSAVLTHPCCHQHAINKPLPALMSWMAFGLSLSSCWALEECNFGGRGWYDVTEAQGLRVHGSARMEMLTSVPQTAGTGFHKDPTVAADLDELSVLSLSKIRTGQESTILQIIRAFIACSLVPCMRGIGALGMVPSHSDVLTEVRKIKSDPTQTQAAHKNALSQQGPNVNITDAIGTRNGPHICSTLYA